MEIFRKNIRSVGQHMVLYNKKQLPENWGNFKNCVSLNNLRGHDGYSNFSLKYPFATIHFLIAVLGTKINIDISKESIAPLLFTDGTWMNLLGYTENSLSWLEFLRADEQSNPLNKIFLNKHYSLHELMQAMDAFLRERDAISIPRERGDRITITLRGGEGTPHNLVIEEEDFYLNFHIKYLCSIETFLKCFKLFDITPYESELKPLVLVRMNKWFDEKKLSERGRKIVMKSFLMFLCLMRRLRLTN